MIPPALPKGTVTFLFTDVEGSTRLLTSLGVGYADALLEHRRVLRTAFAGEGGVEVDTQGDAFFVAFPTASGAAAAALAGTRALAGGPIRVRIGIHTGEPAVTSEGYVGMDVHRGARIAASGHGGQILVSEQTQKLLGERDDLHDLGYHRLKDMGAAERIFQLGEGDFAPLRSLNQTNLPIQATPFLGRAAVLAEIVALLRRDDVRLVTLLGPGGTGKTRLGLQAAAEVAEDYPDGGVWFVSLAALVEPELMLSAIAQALGLRDAVGGGALELVAGHIRGRATLLLIDNLEQLLPAAARPLAALLAQCPRLELVVTSREPLRVAAEREFPVAPFPREEAVAFFCERAQAARPSFALSNDNRDAVEAVCARLDDLPLAVELAAARVRTLSPPALLARLEQRLPLLVGGARDAPERQRTLRGAIAWSHDLLPPAERQMFARLAVFSGGWTLDTAEEVCGATVDGLETLIDKSLVTLATAPTGEPRYSMLATIREFAVEQLESGDEVGRLRRCHAEAFCAVVEEAEDGLKGSQQARWLAQLDSDQDNVRAALEWSLAHDPGTAVRMAAALWLFWYMRGQVAEGRGWLSRALAAGVPMPSRARAKALDGAGYLAGEQADLAAEQALLEESLECARLVGADEDVAIATSHLAFCFVVSDSERAWELSRQAVALARTSGTRWTLAMTLNNLGGLAHVLGKPGFAEFLHESYRLRREAGDSSRLALSLVNLADIALENRETAEARVFLAEALELAEQLGDKRHIVHAHLCFGYVALAEGGLEEAARHLVRCLRLARDLGQIQNLLYALLGMAAVMGGQGDSDRAARLAAAAATLRSLVIQDPAEAHYGVQEPYLAAARVAAGDEAWHASWREGTALSLDAAVDLALGGGPG